MADQLHDLPRPSPRPEAVGEPTGDGARELAGIVTEFARLTGDARAAASLTVTGPADVLPSLYRVTAAATIATAAAAHGAAELWAARSGDDCPPVTVDTRHAAAAFRGERLLRIGGQPAPSPSDPLTGYYTTRDDRWIQVHCNLPHHRAGVLELLGARAEPASVAQAIARHDAASLEAELQSMGMCATMARAEPEWWAHPAGHAVAGLPLIEIEQLDEGVPPAGPSAMARFRGTTVPSAPAQALSAQAQAVASPARPAAGLRVLDMTRATAGPVCGRALASFGADVLRVGAAHLPDSRTLLIDTGFGKRGTFLNLRVGTDARRLRDLVAAADVVIQAYRPKALDRLGFGPEDLARIRPGLVCATISAYGRLGPWSGLRGFDGLVQTASGLAVESARAAGSDRPQPLPASALSHATGHLAAYGVLAALARREGAGGSWHVRLSLAQTGRWLMGLGQRDTLAQPGLSDADVDPFRRTMRSEFGELSYIAAPGVVGGAARGYDRPPSSLGAHSPGWAPIR
ncbi:CoA transferase [Pseudofrankia sp. DC12]|uniref:CoA transferase n=1 Tax=Pseudofrankia sp. DC12 TaxID=683315 RepID=UPI000698EB2E|nr:CoA transferase [Pseudofrankia sp. DC12]